MAEIRTISIKEINKSWSYSVQDNSPRGVKTVSGHDIKVGDWVVIRNYFHKVTE